MKYIKIETFREYYSVRDVSETMTAGELISLLESYDEDTPVYLSFDRGYTYGRIDENEIEEIEEDNEEDFENGN